MKRIKRILICILACVLILPSFGCKSAKVEIYDFEKLRNVFTGLDLFNIAYHNGDIERFFNNELLLRKEYPDFKPQKIKKIEFSFSVKRKIKKALVNKYKERPIFAKIKPRDFKIEYLGEYQGYYVCKYVSDRFAKTWENYFSKQQPQIYFDPFFYKSFLRKNGEKGAIKFDKKYKYDEPNIRNDWMWIAVKVINQGE